MMAHKMDITPFFCRVQDTAGWRAVYTDCIESFIFDRIHDKIFPAIRVRSPLLSWCRHMHMRTQAHTPAHARLPVHV